MVYTLLAVAEGEAKDFQIKDVRKLYRVADYLDIEFEGRPVNDVAKDVAPQTHGGLWTPERGGS